MVFGWLKRKAEISFSNMERADLERFTLGLRGADDAEVGGMVTLATFIRINLEESGEFPRQVLDFSMLRDDVLCTAMPLRLNQTIKQFQKMDQNEDAAGTMVWLHSVRALNNPIIRLQGRQMWGELQRGFGTAAANGPSLLTALGRSIPLVFENEVRFIPVGLEPR